jgi:hypothetical protein
MPSAIRNMKAWYLTGGTGRVKAMRRGSRGRRACLLDLRLEFALVVL